MADPTYRNLAAAILTAHQRHRGGCLCGWDRLGASHPEHVASVLDAACVLRTAPPPAPPVPSTHDAPPT